MVSTDNTNTHCQGQYDGYDCDDECIEGEYCVYEQLMKQAVATSDASEYCQGYYDGYECYGECLDGVDCIYDHPGKPE
jgi:hypothetical protein